MDMTIKSINVKILDKRIGTIFPLPKYMTDGSAGLDLRVCSKGTTILSPNTTQLLSTGISIHLSDPNITAMILPRSGLGHLHGIVLGNLIGLLDSDYQGELKISIWNRSNKDFVINPGDRISQLVILPVIKVNLNIVKEFKKTDRGIQGFGHTGVL